MHLKGGAGCLRSPQRPPTRDTAGECKSMYWLSCGTVPKFSLRLEGKIDGFCEVRDGHCRPEWHNRDK